MRLRIALVEPYFGGSHRAFAEGYRAASRHRVELFTLPASFWKWRMQGGFLTLSRQVARSVDASGPFDVVLATSMLDLARFLGTGRSVLDGAAVALYMHESQLTYPTAPRDEFDLTYGMTNWASMCAADLVLFNSEFHRSAWFEALPAFLRRLPDDRHNDAIPEVQRTSEVMPVGVDLARLDGPRPARGEGRPLVLWNQRWEHDKGPDLFAGAMLEAVGRGMDFDLALAGERFVSDPTGFEHLREALGDRVVHYGYASDGAYEDLLRRSDVVVSTSRQEFFGIAITEAVYAGAFPLLPNALVYPERIPEVYHSRCLYEDQDGLLDGLFWALANRDESAAIASGLRSIMASFDWSVVGPMFDARLERLGGSR